MSELRLLRRRSGKSGDGFGKHHVWDEDNPREWKDVVREAKARKEPVHLGYLFGICVEKNSELSPEHRK